MKKVAEAVSRLVLSLVLVMGLGVNFPAVAYGDPAEIPADLPPLEGSISYSAPVECGKETVFTMRAYGAFGEGSYKYKPVSLRVIENGTYTPVSDFSYKNFTTDPNFKYTFNIPGNYQLQYNVLSLRDGYKAAVKICRETFVVTDPSGTHLTQPQREAKVKQIVDSVYQECLDAGNPTTYDKVLFFHDWVIDHCVYDNSLMFIKAENVFLEGTGTCEGYHAAFSALLSRAGIPNGRIVDDGHVWTSVNIDGQWCYIDTTGDDTEPYYGLTRTAARRLIFGLDEATVNAWVDGKTKGAVVRGKTPYVTSSSLSNNYLIRSREVTTYSSPMIAPIQQQLYAGKSSFSVDVALKNIPNTYKALIYGPVAYELSNRSWTFKGKPARVSVSYKLNYANADDKVGVATLECQVQDGNSVAPATPTQPTSPSQPSQPSQPNNPNNPPSSSVKTEAIFRLYNRWSGEHFYTKDQNEQKHLVSVGWSDEGLGWNAPLTGTPVYRLYNKWSGDHHYTTDESERAACIKAGWTDEGVSFYSAQDTGTKVYRLYNKYVTSFYHHYTTDINERNNLIRVGWIDEQVGWYGL